MPSSGQHTGREKSVICFQEAEETEHGRNGSALHEVSILLDQDLYDRPEVLNPLHYANAHLPSNAERKCPWTCDFLEDEVLNKERKWLGKEKKNRVFVHLESRRAGANNKHPSETDCCGLWGMLDGERGRALAATWCVLVHTEQSLPNCARASPLELVYTSVVPSNWASSASVLRFCRSSTT